MIIPRVLKKIILAYLIFFKTKKDWQLLSKKDVLIYDSAGIDVLKPYLLNYSSYTLFTLSESVNIPCLFLCLFNRNFWLGKPWKAYTYQVIKAVSPTAIISLIDNYPPYYQIAIDHPSLLTIFIQNGWRGGSADSLLTLPTSNYYKVDYMFVFNDAIAKKYRQFIQGETIVIGSLKNNFCICSKFKPDVLDQVVFVSQYREKNQSSIRYIDVNNQPVYWDDFYKVESLLIQWLASWCLLHNKQLNICGLSSIASGSKEELWFKEILDGVNDNWRYFPQTSLCSSYDLIESAEIIVSVDSTLGYEAFARGKKTGFISGRGSFIDDENRTFGWPAELADSGLFWSNNPIRSELLRIMDYLEEIPNDEWKKVSEEYRKNIMAFDPGNEIFNATLKSIFQKIFQKD